MALGAYLGAGSGVTKGLYHLDANSNDSSGNANNGSASNVTWVGGKIGSGAASFSGSSSSITTGTSSAFTFTNAMTVILWFNSTDGVPSQYLFEVWEGTTTNQVAFIYGYVDYRIETFITIGGTQRRIYVTPTVSNGVWHQVGATYDGTTLRTYYDGMENANLSISGNITSSSAPQLYIGRSKVADYAKVQIDEFLIEKKVWSAAEIRKYYTYSKGRFGII